MTPLFSLLKEYGDGYPESYLSARLKPRLVSFYSSARPVSLRQHVTRYQGIKWSYRQSSRSLRRRFSRLYLYLQLPLLLESVRFVSAGMTQQANSNLSMSLWNKSVIHTFATREGKRHPAEKLCQLLTDYGWEFTSDSKDGPINRIQNLEKSLCAFILTPDRKCPENISKVLAVLRDLYNITMSVTHDPQPSAENLLPSGRIPAADILGPKGPQRAISTQYTPLPVETDPVIHICRSFSSELFRTTRHNTIDESLAAYLWQLSVYAGFSKMEKATPRKAA